MGKFRTLSILLGLLLISQVVSAQVHHEEYDPKGEIDPSVLIFYLEDSFSILNETLNEIRDIDIDKARDNSIQFNKMIRNARNTLEKVPDIGNSSYELLNSSVALLGEIEIHLDSLVEGSELVQGSNEELKGYHFNDWNTFSISDNLTKADRGMIQFDEGISQMTENRQLLLDEITSFKGKEIGIFPEGKGMEILQITEKEKILGEISTTIDMLEMNRTSLNTILTRLVDAPIEEWKKDLNSILEETEPESNLSEMNIILEASNVQLSEEMTENISSIVERLETAVASINSIRVDQISFLANIMILEDRNDTSLVDQIGSFNICNSSIGSMMVSWEGSNNAMKAEPLNNSTLIDSHLLVSDLISDYQERLDNATKFEVDLKTNIDALSGHFTGNLLNCDIDENGTLEDDEVTVLTLDVKIIEGLESILEELTNLSADLASLPTGTLPGLMDTLPLVREMAELMLLFTESHLELVSDLRDLGSSPTRASQDPGITLSNALGYLSSMSSTLGRIIELNVGLSNHGMEINVTWESILEEQIGLYRSYLVNKGYLLTGPELILTIDRTVAPYDAEIGFSILFIDIHPIDGPFLVSNRTVTIQIDDSEVEILDLRNGMASGTFEIMRSYSIGDHTFRADSLNITGSNIISIFNFTVRKLLTTIFVSPGHLELDQDGTEEVTIEVRDELFRSIDSLVESDLPRSEIVVPGTTEFGPYPLGTTEVSISYNGDNIFESSDAVITIDVKQDPFIVIDSNRTLFGYNDTVEINIILERGNGTLHMDAGDIRFPINISLQGEMETFEIDPHLLGNGTFIFRAGIISNETSTRSGWSNPLMITINLAYPHGEPEEEEPGDIEENNTTVIEVPDPEETGNNEPFFTETILWIMYGIVILTIGILLVYLVIRGRRNKTEKEEREKGFRLPSIYLRKEKNEAVQLSNGMGPEGMKPVRKISLMKDTDRTKMIDQYIDIIESSPHDTGLRSSMTPREVSMRLKEEGLEDKIASGITEDFERSIYRYGEPKKEDLESFSDKVSRVKGWFGSFFSKKDNEFDDNGEVGN